jgi:hypothetical protein
VRNANLFTALAHNTSAITVDRAITAQPARRDLCSRLRLLSTLADASHGHERIVLEARVHLVFRTIARADDLEQRPWREPSAFRTLSDAMATVIHEMSVR